MGRCLRGSRLVHFHAHCQWVHLVCELSNICWWKTLGWRGARCPTLVSSSFERTCEERGAPPISHSMRRWTFNFWWSNFFDTRWKDFRQLDKESSILHLVSFPPQDLTIYCRSAFRDLTIYYTVNYRPVALPCATTFHTPPAGSVSIIAKRSYHFCTGHSWMQWLSPSGRSSWPQEGHRRLPQGVGGGDAQRGWVGGRARQQGADLPHNGRLLRHRLAVRPCLDYL